MSRKKVLVIDDEPNVVTYIETLLQDNGYDTVSAPDGEVGLEMAKKERPDLITLDITMPKKSGVGFYRGVREDEQLKSVPVVIVTAVTGWGGDPKEFEKFISTRSQVPPPDGFVPKPFEEEQLLKAVKDLIG
jgi:CheY-like chemotaxis protein